MKRIGELEALRSLHARPPPTTSAYVNAKSRSIGHLVKKSPSLITNSTPKAAV